MFSACLRCLRPLCGENKGQILSKESLVKGMDAGVFYNIGPGGKAIKKKT